MNTFLFIKGCGVQNLDQSILKSLKETVKKNECNDIALHIDHEFQPLFYASSVCPIFEIMMHCKCSLLLVAGADHLSIYPDHLMRFNALLMDEGMRVYLQTTGSF